MSAAIDAVSPADEIYSGFIPKHNSTVTIEAVELDKLMRIAGSVYAHLYQGEPQEVVKSACDDYSAFCEVLSKEDLRELRRGSVPPAADKKVKEDQQKDAVMRALEKLDNALQKGVPSQEISKLGQDLVAAYQRAMWSKRTKGKKGSLGLAAHLGGSGNGS